MRVSGWWNGVQNQPSNRRGRQDYYKSTMGDIRLMYDLKTIKSTLRIIGYSEYEMNHFINLLKETKNDRKKIKPSSTRDRK